MALKVEFVTVVRSICKHQSTPEVGVAPAKKFEKTSYSYRI